MIYHYDRTIHAGKERFMGCPCCLGGLLRAFYFYTRPPLPIMPIIASLAEKTRDINENRAIIVGRVACR